MKGSKMKRYIVPIAIAFTGVSMFVIGSVSAEPTEGEPPVVPIADTVPDQQWSGPDEAVVAVGDGYRVYGPEAFPTTPQHDQCWSNADVNILLESGTFVIYGNDDPRRWGSHSIGGMNCGPADLPFPEPAPVLEVAAPVAASTEPNTCNP